MQIIPITRLNQLPTHFSKYGLYVHSNPQGQIVYTEVKDKVYHYRHLIPEWMLSLLLSFEATLQEHGLEVTKTYLLPSCYLDPLQQPYFSGRLIIKLLIDTDWLLTGEYYQPNHPLPELLQTISYTQPRQLWRWRYTLPPQPTTYPAKLNMHQSRALPTVKAAIQYRNQYLDQASR